MRQKKKGKKKEREKPLQCLYLCNRSSHRVPQRRASQQHTASTSLRTSPVQINTKFLNISFSEINILLTVLTVVS